MKMPTGRKDFQWRGKGIDNDWYVARHPAKQPINWARNQAIISTTISDLDSTDSTGYDCF